MYDVVIIGAGQAGLAAGYHLQKSNLDYVILEASEQTAGSWPKYYNHLVLFSPAQYSSLPGLDIDGGCDSYPNKDAVIQYLNDYRNYFNLNVQTRKKVEKIKKSNHFFH